MKQVLKNFVKVQNFDKVELNTLQFLIFIELTASILKNLIEKLLNYKPKVLLYTFPIHFSPLSGKKTLELTLI